MSITGGIGEWAIGEDQTDGVHVRVDTLAASAECFAPTLPVVVEPPSLDAQASDFAPSVSSGKTVAPGSLDAEATGFSGSVFIGAIGSPEAAVAEAEAFAPGVSAGASAAPPPETAEASLPVLDVSAGASIAPETANAEAEAFPFGVLTAGALVTPVDARTVITSGGGIGDGAIGEFAIGEGEDVAQNITTELRAVSFDQAPDVSAGAAIQPVPLSVETVLPAPEVHSRRRKPKLLAIAS